MRLRLGLWASSRRLVLACPAGAAIVFVAHVVACGVDGVTPDCSDAAVCSPYIGDAPLLRDAANDTTTDTGSTDATGASTSDAALDADADGG